MEIDYSKGEEYYKLCHKCYDKGDICQAYIYFICAGECGIDAVFALERYDKSFGPLFRFIEENGDNDKRGYFYLTLGYLYEEGIGVAYNKETAILLYRIAVDKGNVKAMLALGLLYQYQYVNSNGSDRIYSGTEMIKYFKTGAKKGCRMSTLQLADIYFFTCFKQYNDELKCIKYYNMITKDCIPYKDVLQRLDILDPFNCVRKLLNKKKELKMDLKKLEIENIRIKNIPNEEDTKDHLTGY